MLELLTDENVLETAERFRNSLLGTRILCYAKTYGCSSSLADFWRGDGVLIARFEGSFTVIADADANFDEINNLLGFMCAEKIMTTQFVAERLNFSCTILKKAFTYDGYYSLAEDVVELKEPYFKEFYCLISKAIPGSFASDRNAYLSFISDFLYRNRRGYARAKCILTDNHVSATAMTAAESDFGAVISGVACDERYRKYGLGKKIVLTLTQELILENKTVYVIALNESAEGFYRHIGFKEAETIAFVDRKAK